MPAYRTLPIVLFSQLVITPCPLTYDRLGRPIVGPCLIWIKAKDRHGYGVLGNRDFGDTKIRRVHRVMYALFTGWPLADLYELPELDHLCRVPACASPAHLEEVTHAVNIARGDWKYNEYNRNKTECDHGHPFDDANTYWSPRGGRVCRACRQRRYAEWDRRRISEGRARKRTPKKPRPVTSGS